MKPQYVPNTGDALNNQPRDRKETCVFDLCSCLEARSLETISICYSMLRRTSAFTFLIGIGRKVTINDVSTDSYIHTGGQFASLGDTKQQCDGKTGNMHTWIEEPN